MLEITNLTAGYVKENPILKGVNLSINKNEVVGVFGQNGSGKSTLAKAIMGLVPNIKGQIKFNSESIISKTSNEISEIGIGFFIQGGRIFPNLTVKENLEFAARMLNKKDNIKQYEYLKEYFDLLKNGRENLKASYLSGGEKHQLALALVLIRKPNLLILDEPSAGLSPKNVIQLFKIIEQVKINFNTSILLIEQNVYHAVKLSNKIALLKSGVVEKFLNSLSFTDYEFERFFFNEKITGE